MSYKVCIDKFYHDKIRFDGISVEEAKSSTFRHDGIYHLAKYLGQPFTTGSVWSAKTEIMRESGEWEKRRDYPFHSR